MIMPDVSSKPAEIDLDNIDALDMFKMIPK